MGLLPLLLLAACEPDLIDRKPVVRTYDYEGFHVSFFLITPQRDTATVFRENESLRMVYTINNNTGDTLYFDESISNPFLDNERFGYVYRVADDVQVNFKNTGDITLQIPERYDSECFHLHPKDSKWSGGIYCSESIEALPKGKYYVGFSPRLAYRSTCVCRKELSEPPIIITLPEFRIDFEIID